MAGSIGSCLRVGVATLTAAAVVAIPQTAPAAAPAGSTAVAAQVQPAPRVELAAAVRSLITTPPNPQHFAAATAAMARIDPAGTSATIAAPATLNAASDAIVAGYQFLRYWVTYGVQLADYVLGFVPFGYAIADQVNIVYYNLILPISDSVVYNLIVPVVNDPLNLASYVNGLIAVGQTSVNALINTGVAEFNYFFGWLIPPLPPLPPRPLAVAREMPVVEEASEVQEIQEAPEVGEAPATGAEPSQTAEPSPTAEPSTTPQPAATADPSESAEPTKTPETPEPTETPKPSTTTSVDGVQAQGEVRGGTTGATTTTVTTTTTTGTATGTHPTTATTPAAEPHTETANSPTGSDDTGTAENDED